MCLKFHIVKYFFTLIDLKLLKYNLIVNILFYFSLIRDQILVGDFSTIVKLLQVIELVFLLKKVFFLLFYSNDLQNYPNVETRVILNKAAELNIKNKW